MGSPKNGDFSAIYAKHAPSMTKMSIRIIGEFSSSCLEGGLALQHSLSSPLTCPPRRCRLAGAKFNFRMSIPIAGIAFDRSTFAHCEYSSRPSMWCSILTSPETRADFPQGRKDMVRFAHACVLAALVSSPLAAQVNPVALEGQSVSSAEQSLINAGYHQTRSHKKDGDTWIYFRN